MTLLFITCFQIIIYLFKDRKNKLFLQLTLGLRNRLTAFLQRGRTSVPDMTLNDPVMLDLWGMQITSLAIALRPTRAQCGST